MKKEKLKMVLLCLAALSGTNATGENMKSLENEKKIEQLEKIRLNKDKPEIIQALLPIVYSSAIPSKYEKILITQLRNCKTSKAEFREISNKLAGLLVEKVVDCLPTRTVRVETPLTTTEGEELSGSLELVSIMRSGDALLESFLKHFPQANVSKILVQRDEKTALPTFQYMKLTSGIIANHEVIILEPMIATGGTLEMVIQLLKDRGVKEEHIIIASICAAPEGLIHLQKLFPNLKVVLSVLDDWLNDRKYIVPGIGDFGDRYFGTIHEE